jgi:hypothetical protein
MPIKPIIVHKGERTQGSAVDAAAQARVEAVAATESHVREEGGRMITAFTVAFNPEGEPMIQNNVDTRLEGASTLTIAIADMPYRGRMVDAHQGAGPVPAHLAELSYGEM